MSRYIDYDAIDYRNDRLHDKSEEFLNGVIYMAQRIEEAPSIDIEPKRGEWIPCSERLPSNFSEDETVLVTTDVDGDRVIPMFAFDVKSFYRKGYISAWMPLPEPYREREGE